MTIAIRTQHWVADMERRRVVVVGRAAAAATDLVEYTPDSCTICLLYEATWICIHLNCIAITCDISQSLKYCLLYARASLSLVGLKLACRMKVTSSLVIHSKASIDTALEK